MTMDATADGYRSVQFEEEAAQGHANDEEKDDEDYEEKAELGYVKTTDELLGEVGELSLQVGRMGVPRPVERNRAAEFGEDADDEDQGVAQGEHGHHWGLCWLGQWSSQPATNLSKITTMKTPETKKGERFRATAGTPYFEDSHMLSPKKNRTQLGRNKWEFEEDNSAEAEEDSDDGRGYRPSRDETGKDQIYHLSNDRGDQGGSLYLELRSHVSLDKIAQFDGRRYRSDDSLQWLKRFIYEMKGTHMPQDSWMRYYSAKRKDKETICDFLTRLNGYARTAKIQYERGGADAADYVEQSLLNCGDDDIMDMLYPLQLNDIHRVEQIISKKILGEKRKKQRDRLVSGRSRDETRRDDRRNDRRRDDKRDSAEPVVEANFVFAFVGEAGWPEGSVGTDEGMCDSDGNERESEESDETTRRWRDRLKKKKRKQLACAERWAAVDAKKKVNNDQEAVAESKGIYSDDQDGVAELERINSAMEPPGEGRTQQDVMKAERRAESHLTQLDMSETCLEGQADSANEANDDPDVLEATHDAVTNNPEEDLRLRYLAAAASTNDEEPVAESDHRFTHFERKGEALHLEDYAHGLAFLPDLNESLKHIAPPSKNSATVRLDPELLYAKLPRHYKGHVLSFDGSAKTEKNGGYGSCSWILWHLPEWNIEIAVSAYLSSTTVNLAEYTGMNNGVKAAIDRGVTDLVIVGDSQLAIQQSMGVIAYKKETLQVELAHHKELTKS
ncbi:Hypothetical protein PHPALM_12154 [Phytophthora palmivora]|uniref:RNase H type-1 domain-containing protein n=1 Tax=Phytophthora palmivora TaxID=4796 RepID=A0A2P4Y0F9_9STRA|nr:Hypothetical protein PHPALM_12154 [Phytophthora palmivora]